MRHMGNHSINHQVIILTLEHIITQWMKGINNVGIER